MSVRLESEIATASGCEAAYMTMRWHRDEVRIDEELVQQLLRTQLPDLANQELRLVPAQGTDNVCSGGAALLLRHTPGDGRDGTPGHPGDAQFPGRGAPSLTLVEW